jgi:hypothetical protein
MHLDNSAAHVKPKHAAGAARPWPSVETDGFTDRPGGPDAVRYLCALPAAFKSGTHHRATFYNHFTSVDSAAHASRSTSLDRRASPVTRPSS